FHLATDEVEPLRKQYTKIIDAYGCLGVLCMTAGNDKIQYLVMVNSCLSVGKIGESEVFRITGVSFISLRNDPSDEDRIGEVGSHKVHMSRGYEMAAPAFDRHLRTIKLQYGDQVLINLLGNKEGEKMLSQAFMNHHSASAHSQDIPYYHFDYHSEVKGSNLKNLEKLKSRIIKHLHQFEFFCTNGKEVSHHQTGTIRTNCLDCLDRTNATQTMIGMEMLIKQLEALGLSAKPQMVGRFEEVYKQIWVHNGDHISRIYTGTGALGGGRSKYSDASRTASRTIQNNFLDGSKQEAIDILLMGSSLSWSIFCTPCQLMFHGETYRVCVGTYNVNGGKHYRSIAYKHQSLADWLLDAHKSHPNVLVDHVDYDYDRPVDIFAVGFEEIVDLNASNIMSASTTNAREWQKEVIKTISRDHKYVIVTSIQLVGVVLYVFVRPHLAPFIRDVAVEKVKTGLGGAAGNKGGVAVRFLLNSTSLCFVCAHLAAGQSQVNERNADYTEITRKMSFPMGRTILSHDCVFWCGDFNYRIDLSNEEVKSLVASQNWGALQGMDQLNIQRSINNCFHGFNEGSLDFAPTYKYDTFSDDYDTSEKGRTPAWTDRVLWKVKTVKNPESQLYSYLPVVAVFDVDTVFVEEDKKNAVLNKVVEEQGPPDGTVIISTLNGQELSDEVVNAVVEKFNEVGDIVIVRFVGMDMWILYQQGVYALEALQFDQQEFAGVKIRVSLKTTDWKAEIEKELNLCSSNTGALYNQFTNTLLGDDFSVPSMEFDIGEDDDEPEDAEVENALQGLTSTPPSSSSSSTPTGKRSPAVPQGDIPGGPPTNPPRPVRPAMPSPSPNSSSNSWSSSQMVTQEVVQPLRASPLPEPKQPPARPSAPPAKPPPPQRPPGGPPRPVATQSGSSQPMVSGTYDRQIASQQPKTRQILRPAPIDKSKLKKPANKIAQIGFPTNVTHHGHASSIEEAQALIQKLLVNNMDQDDTCLPAALVPSKSETNLSSGWNQLGAPKSVARSKTSQDIGESAASELAPPQALPRKQSLDRDAPVEAAGGSAPLAKPRPAPRREVQSMAWTSDASPSETPPSPAKRPGSVMVLPPPPASARPAPPPPARPTSTSNTNPVPPARPTRQLDKVSPTHSSKNSPMHDISDGNTHLLDRDNSLIEGDTSEPDPFDTTYARIAPRPSPVGTDLNDPFDTSRVNRITQANPIDNAFENAFSKNEYDPFDTRHVHSSGQPSMANWATPFSAFSPESDFQAPNMSPPPLPSTLTVSFKPQLSIPEGVPPPPPRDIPGVPPPVPNRSTVVPPPVPKRPV
uniref:phosphoinositide 5-phosphatase n=1 Tax=Biomphalaria glabrata TaxID=6526 RepID=A0A2C9JV86_BIOGL